MILEGIRVVKVYGLGFKVFAIGDGKYMVVTTLKVHTWDSS